MPDSQLKNHIYETFLSLVTDDGINASGRNEAYGCIFGRDSAITVLKILNVVVREIPDSLIDRSFLKDVCKKSLLKLCQLQGKEINIESGEQPGKFIHEYRKEKYNHLIQRENPWFVYPDGILRNFDSIDVTPLTLIAIHKFWQTNKDGEFLEKALPSVKAGLDWILNYGDLDRDDILEYDFPQERKYGGLAVQSWTDSRESLRQPDGSLPKYPIAPVEVQGYAWLALRLWSNFFRENEEEFSLVLEQKSRAMKKKFNESFIFRDNGCFFLAQALDGHKNQVRTITGNPILVLWASEVIDGRPECILEEKYIPDLVARAFQKDLFDESAGIRTMSTLSPTYNPGNDSYHNGSFWPKLNGMAYGGLKKWSYFKEAEKLKEASLKPIGFFGGPIELYIKNDQQGYSEYLNSCGQKGCREQAWSAAVALDLLTA